MAIFAAYAMFSLYQSGEKRVAACLLVLLALQPVFYVPPIHTPFRSGMTYEWFPEQTIRAASWISSYSAGEIVGTDLRLSNLIYGYSRGQVGASFAWAEPMNLTLVDEPAIRYGLSLGYFGFHASFPETAFSKLDSSLYQRVYDNGRAWVFSPTFRDATFMGGNDRALLCEEPREFATRPESVSSEESAASEGSLPFTIFLGAGFGFVLALTVFPLCAGRRSDSRESMKSPLRMREFGSASQS